MTARLVLILVAFVALLTFQHHGVEASLDGRIVNGVEARSGEVPYQAELKYNWYADVFRGYCGGAFIRKDIVITAAHCMKDK